MMEIARDDRSLIGAWWTTVDRVLIGAVLALSFSGLVLTLAASPAIAIKKGLPAFYFVERHALWIGLGAATMLAVSLLGARALRRLSLGLLVAMLVLMAMVLVTGPELNGAKRWLRLGGLSLQPSELAKPAFVVVVAWLLVEAQRRPDMPARALALGLFLTFVGLLALQPDIGQSVLVGAVFLALFIVSGQPLGSVALLASAGAAAFGAAFATLPHVRSRVQRFLDPALGESYQLDRALQSFVDGGFFGRGPGEGTIKGVLPDAHTDFILAVVAEEYGALACLSILALIALVALRPILRSRSDRNVFNQLAALGLALLVGLQALINMGVNVGLLPAKGITLPFISSGGSSTIAMALAAGMLLAVTRRRVEVGDVKLPTYAVG